MASVMWILVLSTGVRCAFADDPVFTSPAITSEGASTPMRTLSSSEQGGSTPIMRHEQALMRSDAPRTTNTAAANPSEVAEETHAQSDSIHRQASQLRNFASMLSVDPAVEDTSSVENLFSRRTPSTLSLNKLGVSNSLLASRNASATSTSSADKKRFDDLRVHVSSLTGAFIGYVIILLGATICWVIIRNRKGQALANASRDRQDRQRLSVVAMGADADEPGETRFTQAGYANLFLGRFVYVGWIALILISQLYMGWLLIIFYRDIEVDHDNNFLFVPWAVVYYSSGIGLMACLQLPLVRHWFLARCSLNEATHVLIEEEDNEPDADNLGVGLSHLYAILRNSKLQTLAPVILERTLFSGDGPQYRRKFFYTCVSYIWEEQRMRFCPSGSKVFKANAVSRDGLDKQTARELQSKNLNTIDVPVPSISQALLTEFCGGFYIFQLYAIWLCLAWLTWNSASIFFGVSVTCGVINSLFIVRRQQMKVKGMAEFDERVEVLRDRSWQSISSTEIVVGDVLRLASGIVPCDCILVDGAAVTNESMLTGEPMPVQKFSLEPSDDDVHIKRHKKNLLLAGTNLTQATNAIAVCNATGAMTTKGQLVRMVLFPSPVRFKFTGELPYVYGLLSVYALACFLIIVMGPAASGLTPVFLLFEGSFCVIAVLNPLLPISLSAANSLSVSKLRDDGILCLAPPRLTVAGKLHVMVFDKTGTLTQSGMDLSGLKPAGDNGIGYFVRTETPESIGSVGDLWSPALGGCHSVAICDNKLVGPELEVRMLEASGWELQGGEKRVLKKKDTDQDIVEVLRVLEFDHHRMTSGALVRIITAQSTRNVLFVKGSYEKVGELCTVPANYMQSATSSAADSFYVLGMAYREVQEAEISALTVAPRAKVEAGLTLLGLVLFRNELKSDSAACLAELRGGRIRNVMCTGDNVFTGVSVAKECGMILPDRDVFIGDAEKGVDGVVWKLEGRTVERAEFETREDIELAVTGAGYNELVRTEELDALLMRIRVFARMTPDQKVDVVKGHQERQLIVGMCGDGGNDCAALRAAHVGVALSDAEASIVAPFSSGADKSVKAVVRIAKMGRACLTTNLASFKFFIMAGLAETFWKVESITVNHSVIGEWEFLFMDIIAPVFVTLAMTYCCRAHDVLAPRRPASSFFGPHTILAVCVPHAFYIVTYLLVQCRLYAQTWFVFPTEELSTYIWEQDIGILKSGDNYHTSSIFVVIVTYYVCLAVAYSHGGLFRKPVYRNISMLLLLVGVLSMLCFILFHTDTRLNCLFRVNCSNKQSVINYIPGATEFSVLPEDCFYGPQAKKWTPQYNISKSTEPYALPGRTRMVTPTRSCWPPESLHLPSIDGDLGPNNILPSDWRIFVIACALSLGCLTNIFMAFFLDPLSRLILNKLPGTSEAAYERRVPI